jgi:hypothetical protein
MPGQAWHDKAENTWMPGHPRLDLGGHDTLRAADVESGIAVRAVQVANAVGIAGAAAFLKINGDGQTCCAVCTGVID